jgi:hypothetical protein
LASCPLVFAVGKAKLVGWMDDQSIMDKLQNQSQKMEDFEKVEFDCP